MGEILKEEVRRSLRSRGMLMSLVIGGIIAAAQLIQYQIPKSRWNLTTSAFEDFPIVYPFSAADSWLGGGAVDLEAFLLSV